MTEQEKLIKENEIMAKVILEMVYRDKGNMTDEQIDELFKSEDWREKTEFKLMEDKDGWWLDYKWVHSWSVRPRKPLAILKRLYQEKEDQKILLHTYQDLTGEQAVKIEELEQKVKELQIKQEDMKDMIEELEERVVIEQEEAKKAVDKSDEWHKRKVFELGMKEYSRITELRLKIQELENTLEVKNEKIAKLSKPTKLQKVRKSVKAIKEKVHTKVHTVGGKFQEKLCAYILQSHILQKNK